MIEEYQTCPDMGKQSVVTQKLCDYINAEGEPDETQPAHYGPRENWLWLLDGDKGKAKAITYNGEWKQERLIWWREWEK